MLNPALSVRMRGLEPPRPKAQPPEDCVSTNFTTCAIKVAGKINNFIKQTYILLTLLYNLT